MLLLEVVMSDQMLSVDCTELRIVAEEYPDQIEVVIEMMVEAHEELCQKEAAWYFLKLECLSPPIRRALLF